MSESLLRIELLDEGSLRVDKIFIQRATCGKVEQSKTIKNVFNPTEDANAEWKSKKVFDHTRAGNGGSKYNCKTKKVFGVSHTELKNHVSRVKKPLMACEPHFAHIWCGQFNCKINDVASRPRPAVSSVAKRTRSRCGRSGVRFPGRSNQRSVANGSPPLRRFFGDVYPRRLAVEMGPATRYTLRRNTASIMKIWFHLLPGPWR